MSSSITDQKNLAIVQFMERRTHQSTVQEYRKEIHNHLLRIEMESEEHPVPQPLQAEILSLRNSLLCSLFDVTRKLSWSTSTFSLATNLTDKYTSFVEINPCDYRMVGYCCLWIASKYNENKPKGKLANALLRNAGYDISCKEQFLNLEFKILTFLNWELSYSTSESFLDLFLNNSEPNNYERRFGSIFLCELAEFEEEVCFNYSPSSIAAAAIVITNTAILNNKNKQSIEDFDELEKSMMRSLLNIPSSVHSKYTEKSGALPYKHVIIEQLIGLAVYLEQQQQEINSFIIPCPTTTNFPLDDFVLYSNFPLSPIASPTLPQNKPSPSPPLYHAQPALSSRKRPSHLDTARATSGTLITPGATPTSASLPIIVGGVPQQHFFPPHIFGISNQQQVITPDQLTHPHSVVFSQGKYLWKPVLDDFGYISHSSTEDFDDGKTLKRRRV